MIHKIGFFDSGIGGRTVLSAVRRWLPDEEYFYIADSENCPYGNKSQEELEKIVVQNVEKLREWGAEIIVVACNTATTKCIEFLRTKYPDLKFVGTEPAIRLAAESGFSKILVLATPGTIEAERTLELVAKNRRDGQEIDLLACPGLAETIERAVSGDFDANADINVIVDTNAVRQKLDELFSGVSRGYDAVVLGCTHYPLIRGSIQEHFPKAALIDGADGVARRVTEVLKTLEKS